MLVKFESRSNRVKGCSFHPKRPWVLSSLHNGCVQLWDYRMGPVRGVSFHSTQPLFVSGGDDYKIKVWNYKQRKCLFTLTGHLDYIRTVFFHHEYPWIVSCSDDQTIRIWNWQSRQCISILTGHNHYVMCAQFHPKDDLLVSASLDQTVRVWDISGLRKKNYTPQSAPTSFPEEIQNRLNNTAGNQGDLFANTDVLVKYVLEGHERGVNWAAFHPTLPLIVSGGDDRQVKLWRMSETKAWEVDTCRGHYNNVSCAIFHPRQELLISDSEDRSIRVWDMTKRTAVQNFRRETDRFWIMQAHPNLNLFAAGHDTGLIVFKFERERPAFTVYDKSLFYVKDKHLRHFDLETGADNAVITIKKASGLNNQPRSLSYNPAENSVLLTTPVEGGQWDMYPLPKDYANVMDPRDVTSECKSGAANSAIFVARNRYVTLQKSTQQLTIKTIGKEGGKIINLPGDVLDVFYAGTGLVLMTTATSVYMMDLQQEVKTFELITPTIKYLFWSPDGETVALVGKHSLIFANKKLEQLSIIHETIRMKSGVWDSECDVFVYSTLNHIKYALPVGDNGIIRTLENPVYIVKSSGNNLYCLDRECKAKVLTIEPTEYRFKLALVERKYEDVLQIIRNSNLVGQSIIAYLRQKGYPEVALNFVKDPRTRFDLSLECGNLDVALQTAKELDLQECWSQLSAVALKTGNTVIVEQAYQRIKAFEKLSFLYVCTGEEQKLRKMSKIAELRGDVVSQFHNLLFLGDVEEQVRVLAESGQAPLAYMMAVRHGLTEQADAILSDSGRSAEDAAQMMRDMPKQSTLLVPPRPILKSLPGTDTNWPQLAISRGLFESAAFMGAAGNSARDQSTIAATNHAIAADEDLNDVGGDWGIDDDLLGDQSAKNKSVLSPTANGAEEGGWDIDEDLNVDLEGINGSAPSGDHNGEEYSVPPPGPSSVEWWTRNSQLGVDHVAAGAFESAMQIYNRQAGISHFEPLKTYFMAVYRASHSSLSTVGGSVSLKPSMHRNWQEINGDMKKLQPVQPFTFASIIKVLQAAYQATTVGKFTEVLELFLRILHTSLFIVATKRSEVDEIKQLIEVSREYILGMRMELARKDLPADTAENKKRAVELAAYFTHCKLQPTHTMLSLRLAMAQAFKLGCFASAASFARRLLELGPTPQLAQQARKVQEAAEKHSRDDVALAYDALNPFVLCAKDFVPIYKGSPVAECTFCYASYQLKYLNTVCAVCRIAKVGTGAASGGVGGNLKWI